jgi:hypothetical protein
MYSVNGRDASKEKGIKLYETSSEMDYHVQRMKD